MCALGGALESVDLLEMVSKTLSFRSTTESSEQGNSGLGKYFVVVNPPTTAGSGLCLPGIGAKGSNGEGKVLNFYISMSKERWGNGRDWVMFAK